MKDKTPRDAGQDAVCEDLDKISKNASDEVSIHDKQEQTLVLSEVNYVKKLMNDTRHVLDEMAQQTWEATRMVVVPIRDVFQRANGDEGTEIRKCVSMTRESLNVQLFAAQMQLQKVADNQLVPLENALVVAQKQMMKANEFRREYPEMAAAGLAMVVGIPSLLIRGKWSAIRNSAVAVGAGAVACYRLDKWAEKKRK